MTVGKAGFRNLLRGTWVEVAVGLTLALLGLHAAMYWFLTDDAFISFRYARNFSQGYGLVFNPGYERVEGYTNFLWVLLLAGFQRLGLAPESVANPLSLGATAALWALVVWFAHRSSGGGARWLVLAAPLCLAATRSVAVWSTSGLETRFFEVLIVGGALRLIVETEAQLAGRAHRSLAGLLLALGTLTRPDGLLISLAALGTSAAYLVWWRRLSWRRLAVNVGSYVLVVGAHYAFRRLYYGDWLPNTYYAKVDGRTWWDMGWTYVGLAAVEYAAYLWVPLLAIAAFAYRRRGALYVPLIFAAVIVPHTLYSVAIGGDHFEFRPLDLYFPLIFLLLGVGLQHLARSRAGHILAVGYLVLILAGLVALPYRTHREFPAPYLSGFPGRMVDSQASADYLRPDRDPVWRLPGLRNVAAVHRSLFFETTGHYVAIRQEEHRRCLASLLGEGEYLARLAARTFPADAYVALPCIGVVPYYSNLRVLDQLGLADRRIAHSAPIGQKRYLAHDKQATIADAHERGVDLYCVQGGHLIVPLTDPSWTRLLGMAASAPEYSPVCIADLGEGKYLIAVLPNGLAATQKRFPQLRFQSLRSEPTAKFILGEIIACRRREVERNPGDGRARSILADALLTADQNRDAIAQFRAALETRPDDTVAWWGLALAQANVGERQMAARTAAQALKLAERQGDEESAEKIRREIARLGG